MLYSFEQPLFTNFITSILLKQAEPYYTFALRPIRFIDQNSHNLSCLKSFIWNSSKWTSDIQLVIIMLHNIMCIIIIFLNNYVYFFL